MPWSVAPDSFPILRARAVKDPRPTSSWAAPEASSRISAWQFRSAADYQPGCVPRPDRSREVDRVSAPVLVDVLSHEHRGVRRERQCGCLFVIGVAGGDLAAGQ